MVLMALKRPPFESLSSADLWPLSLKMTLLLALTSVKHLGDKHCQSAHRVLSLDLIAARSF